MQKIIASSLLSIGILSNLEISSNKNEFLDFAYVIQSFTNEKTRKYKWINTLTDDLNSLNEKKETKLIICIDRLNEFHSTGDCVRL